MEFLKDIAKTILGQNEESSNQFLQELRQERLNSTIEQPNTKTEQQKCDDETTIEQTIIKCQRLHGRLLISTSRKLRIRFGNETVDRVINRFAKQRYRGKCPVKAQIKQEEQTPKEIINHYFKTKEKSEFGNSL